jgi:sporulation protein YlmC with PRC-barrel domain
MSEKTEFTIGNEVSCRDGTCGTLKRVVVDPVRRTLTHLVVAAEHGQGTGRLVPIEIVDSVTNEIRLACTSVEFETLEGAEETQFLAGGTGNWDYGQEQMLSWPYYGLGMGVIPGPPTLVHDRVPPGEVEVRRGEHVYATDGAIGRVQGLVVDPRDHHVTHVLLDEGHLWGHKRVAIPITAVMNVDQGIRLNLTKGEVRDLPPIDLHDNA